MTDHEIEVPPGSDRDLVVLLSKALRLAGDAGRPVAASRLAAKAYWALSETDPKGAQRINGLMHYLARLPEEAEETDTESTSDIDSNGERNG